MTPFSRKNTSIFILKLLVLFFLLLLSIKTVCYFFNNKSLFFYSKKTSRYFEEIPIHSFNAGGIPFVEAQIGNQKLPALLDLGFQGNASVDKGILRKELNKLFIGSDYSCDIKGEKYQRQIYQISKIKLGRMLFKNPKIYEEDPQFNRNTSFSNEDNKKTYPETVRLGWELFYTVNLFLDLANSKIGFCDSFETLQKNGLFLNNFSKVLFNIKSGLIEIPIQIEEKTLQCTLDTGTTLNILNVKSEKSFEQLLFNEDVELEVPSYKINGRNFGEMSFFQLPINAPFPVDAILGMDFFLEHVVFIDFENRVVYIAPKE